MVKLIWILLLLSVACRLFIGRWPWQMLRQSARPSGGSHAEARMQARALLGVGEGASREDILEAHKRLLAIVHPDRGGTNEHVHEANSARDLLLRELAVIDTEPS